MHDGLKIGVVDALQARAAAVVAANPRHAERILGRRVPAKIEPAPPPVVVAAKPKRVSTMGRPYKWPWRTLAIGEYFDVDMTHSTRGAMGKQARMARKRCDARFGVVLAVNKAGRGVIRVTRVA